MPLGIGLRVDVIVYDLHVLNVDWSHVQSCNRGKIHVILVKFGMTTLFKVIIGGHYLRRGNVVLATSVYQRRAPHRDVQSVGVPYDVAVVDL